MTGNGWIQIIFFFLVIVALTRPLGAYMHRFLNETIGRCRACSGRWSAGCFAFAAWIRKGTNLGRIHRGDADLQHYGMVVTYAILRLQQWLPFNPQKLGPVEARLAFNTAASFTTNTNWQNYSGESTMSYLSQMAALAWHNFTSAATGIAIALAVARGLTRRAVPGGAKTIGNFWADLLRATLYVLLRSALLARWCWFPRA